MSADRAPTPASPVGVLFVHGIGEQFESESVRWFADALIGWLRSWHEERAGGRTSFTPEVVSAHLSYGVHSMRGPARVRVRLPEHADERGPFPAREWVIAEGWWAARIDPPSLGQMVAWARRSAGRAVARLASQAAFRVWLIALRVRGRTARPVGASDPGVVGALIELLSTTLLLLLYLLSIPLLFVLVAVLWVITLIPLAQVREFALVRMIEPLLVKGLGDFRTYLQDDIQALHIRARLAEDVRWLVEDEGCTDLVVAAHSHGAVVAFDAITSGQLPYLDRVRKFITVGAALNNAWKLYPKAARVGGTLPSHIFWLDFWTYYDPVPGGRLDRSGSLPLVAPDAALVKTMHWEERFVHPDGTARPGAPATSAMPREVTNGMNVLSDHGAYWENPEQFLSRLAAEIDVPSDYYKSSRFRLKDVAKRSLLRRRRVTTLVGWRLLAMLGAVVAVGGRAAQHGWGRIVDDGSALAASALALPGSDVLGAPAAIFTGVRTALEGVAVAPLGVIADLARSAALVLGAQGWSALWHFLLATLVYAAVFVVLCRLLIALVWRPWDEAEARASVAVEAPAASADWGWRSAVVLAVIAVPMWALTR